MEQTKLKEITSEEAQTLDLLNIDFKTILNTSENSMKSGK